MMRALPILLLLAACGGEKTSDKRVIVLGIDGMDPDLLQQEVDAGTMPHFAKLIDQGSFVPLGTSWPPQSPVAWSNFITGRNPGGHGLFDFIHRDPATYGVKTSMTESDPVGLVLPLGDYGIPLTGGEQRLTRGAPAFWHTLDEAGIPCLIMRMPADFPPVETGAVTFPDMGAPDLAGAASGLSALFLDPLDPRAEVTKDSYYIRYARRERQAEDYERWSGQLLGPPNTLLRAEHPPSTEATFAAHLDTRGANPTLAIEVDGTTTIAELGEWSAWLPVSFDMGLGMAVGGWTRFYLRSAAPLSLYFAPVQIDPFNPVMPVSTPDEASAWLADSIGPYYTQGFPDAYKAYKTGILDTGEFISQSDQVLAERRKMLDWGLERFDRTGGLFFCYFGSLDMRCHMLWHLQDSEHPHQEADASDWKDQIRRVYHQVDAVLGHLMASVGEETTVMVISDHGFAPFRRKMHLNDWLVEEGYLCLSEGVDSGSLTGGEVDWSRSQAYVVGFNGIYLNRTGREANGIVTEEQAGPLLKEIAAKLLALRDADGTAVMTTVLPADQVFSGPFTEAAPDLQLGFNRNYGASDECAVGGIVGGPWLVDNDSRWSGSHLMDPALVPGVFLVNRKVDAGAPKLEDVTATLFPLLGTALPDGLDGRPIF